EHPQGRGPVGRRDTGRDSLRGVHGHRVRGALAVLVPVVHRGQVEPVAVLTGERHADVAGRVAHHEGDQLGGRLLRREDQVAFVLPVLVVDDDHRAAGSDVGQRALDAVKLAVTHRACTLVLPAVPPGAGRFQVHRASPTPPLSSETPPDPRSGPPRSGCASRSRCLASTSTSMFTSSPGSRNPRVVSSLVAGIRATLNSAPPASTTVRETPSTVMEPFSTR